MTSTGAAAELKASVDVRPARSQVFLVAITIVAAILIICSTFLIWSERDAGWIFLIFSALLLGGGYLLWTKSQSDVDLQEAHPTNIALPDGTNVTTDSRILRSPEGLRAMVQLCNEVLCREPLPAPDGLVDSRAQIIPDSKDAAVARTSQINSTIQSNTNALIDALGLADAAPRNVIQQLVDLTDKGPNESIPQNLNAPIVD